MKTHKTIFDPHFKIEPTDSEYSYQNELTPKLDNYDKPFDQAHINEIVLWKVNRYAEVDEETLNLINSIDPNSAELDVEKTTAILMGLLRTKGIQLPMASTILRFRNKHVYQIIDQRVYRIINPNQTLEIRSYQSDKNREEQIDLYIRYLNDLKAACLRHAIPFDDADRILYMADRRINKTVSLGNY